MVLTEIAAVDGFFRRFRLKKIAKQVRAGRVPPGIDRSTIFEALRITRPKGALEMFGILSAKQRNKHGELVRDLGVVGVKKVTLEFAELLADALCSSGAAALMDKFSAHAMGQGSAAEASGDAALSDEEDGRAVGSQTHGASSNIYQSVGTIAATSAYTVIEHGLFNTTGVADDYLLDRTVVNSFVVATDDEVEWTYQLTINTET